MDIPQEYRFACSCAGRIAMDMRKTMSNTTKSIPILYHSFTCRRLGCGLHEIFQTASVCIFEDNVVGGSVEKTPVISDDERRRLTVISEF